MYILFDPNTNDYVCRASNGGYNICKAISQSALFSTEKGALNILNNGGIPKLIASTAEDKFLYHHYREVERGKWKKCSRCGQVKLAHNKYFSKNKTSKDGFYSICKSCRNSKTKKKEG